MNYFQKYAKVLKMKADKLLVSIIKTLMFLTDTKVVYMGQRRIEVMSQDEIEMQSLETETDMEVLEEPINVDHIETAQTSNVIYLSDFRKAMGYAK